jgi:hypothetical protein
VDRAGALEWVAIALAFVAVLVILRYGSRPRCELCRRRHHRRPAESAAAVVPVSMAPVPTVELAPASSLEPARASAGDDALDLELELEIDLTSGWRANGHDHEPAGFELVAISWRADQNGVKTVAAADVEAPA